MSKFLGYTVGLACFVGTSPTSKLVKVEYASVVNNVRLRAVSGRNLVAFPPALGLIATIPLSEFVDRPCDPYDKLAEAKWALAKLGLVPAALDPAVHGL